MGSAMQIYAGFAVLMIAIIAIIVITALLSNLIGAVRRLFGRTRRTHDDFSARARSARTGGRVSWRDNPQAKHESRGESGSDESPASR